MADNSDGFPIEEFYRKSISVDLDGMVYAEIDQYWNPMQDIDWEKNLDLETEEKGAITFAAVNFHYSNISYHLFCGRLIQETDDVTMQNLALMLAFSKVRKIDVWSRYLGKLSADATVASELYEYYKQLLKKNDALSVLIGLEALSGPFGRTVFQEVSDVGGELFQELTEIVIQQKEHNLTLTTDYLADRIADVVPERKAEIEEDAERYRKMMEQLFTAQGPVFQKVGKDATAIREKCIDEVTAFYDEIGLEI